MNRQQDQPNEAVIRQLAEVAIELKRLRLDVSNLHNDLSAIQREMAEMNGGLAVVTSQAKEARDTALQNKKKSADSPISYSLLSGGLRIWKGAIAAGKQPPNRTLES